MLMKLRLSPAPRTCNSSRYTPQHRNALIFLSLPSHAVIPRFFLPSCPLQRARLRRQGVGGHRGGGAGLDRLGSALGLSSAPSTRPPPRRARAAPHQPVAGRKRRQVARPAAGRCAGPVRRRAADKSAGAVALRALAGHRVAADRAAARAARTSPLQRRLPTGHARAIAAKRAGRNRRQRAAG